MLCSASKPTRQSMRCQYNIIFNSSIFSVLQLSKQYGSVYTVYFGPKKVVILSGYKAVKQALVNLSEEFGDRDITPIFHDFNQGYGKEGFIPSYDHLIHTLFFYRHQFNSALWSRDCSTPYFWLRFDTRM